MLFTYHFIWSCCLKTINVARILKLSFIKETTGCVWYGETLHQFHFFSHHQFIFFFKRWFVIGLLKAVYIFHLDWVCQMSVRCVKAYTRYINRKRQILKKFRKKAFFFFQELFFKLVYDLEIFLLQKNYSTHISTTP